VTKGDVRPMSEPEDARATSAAQTRGVHGFRFDAALERGELTVEQVRKVAVHLTPYVGGPIPTGISGGAEPIIRRRAEITADASKG
jgi:hypothetical protein